MSAIAMLKETLKQSQIKNFAICLGLNAIISNLVVGTSQLLKKNEKSISKLHENKKKFVEICAILAS